VCGYVCKLSEARDLTVNGLFLEAMIIYRTTIYFTGTISYGLALGFTCHHYGHLINNKVLSVLSQLS